MRMTPWVNRAQVMRWKSSSCSSAGTVTLASVLVRDQRFQESVVAHELLHRRMPTTHGRLFKALVSAHVPGWRVIEKQRVHSHESIPRQRTGLHYATREARR